jgi:hypothetical protein
MDPNSPGRSDDERLTGFNERYLFLGGMSMAVTGQVESRKSLKKGTKTRVFLLLAASFSILRQTRDIKGIARLSEAIRLS